MVRPNGALSFDGLLLQCVDCLQNPVPVLPTGQPSGQNFKPRALWECGPLRRLHMCFKRQQMPQIDGPKYVAVDVRTQPKLVVKVVVSLLGVPVSRFCERHKVTSKSTLEATDPAWIFHAHLLSIRPFTSSVDHLTQCHSQALWALDEKHCRFRRRMSRHDDSPSSSESKRPFQHVDVDPAGDVDSSRVDVLDDDFGGAEEQGVDLVEVAAGRFKDFQERAAVRRG